MGMSMCHDCLCIKDDQLLTDGLCWPCIRRRAQDGMGTPTAERRKTARDRSGLPRTRSGRGEGPGQGPDPVLPAAGPHLVISRARAAEACEDGPLGEHCPCWDSGKTCCWCGGGSSLL